MYIWDQIDLTDGREERDTRTKEKSPRTGVLHQNGKKNAAYESVTAQFHHHTRESGFALFSPDVEDDEQSTLFGDIRSAIGKHSSVFDNRQGGSLSARSTGSIISSLAQETEIDMDDISDLSHPSRRLNRSGGGISSNGNSDLALLTKQIEEKLATMKEELRNRDASAKELQVLYNHLSNT